MKASEKSEYVDPIMQMTDEDFRKQAMELTHQTIKRLHKRRLQNQHEGKTFNSLTLFEFIYYPEQSSIPKSHFTQHFSRAFHSERMWVRVSYALVLGDKIFDMSVNIMVLNVEKLVISSFPVIGLKLTTKTRRLGLN